MACDQTDILSSSVSMIKCQRIFQEACIFPALFHNLHSVIVTREMNIEICRPLLFNREENYQILYLLETVESFQVQPKQCITFTCSVM